MKDAEPEDFDLRAVIESTVAAYRDAYPERSFDLLVAEGEYSTSGSPELVIQMLDKLVDNAVGFSGDGDAILVSLDADTADGDVLQLGVTNPGPPLPDRMRGQLFDSMVSMRAEKNSKHLGLGLYVARLIAEGHDGRIEAENVEDGVRFTVILPARHS